MKLLLTVLAFLGPIMQFAMAIVSVFVTDFADLQSKYGIPEPLYLEPAPMAFLIWNVIFLSYIALGIYQLQPSLRHDPQWTKARPYVFLSCLGNIIWFLGDFQANLFISLIGFTLMLLTLTQLNMIFQLGESSSSPSERWLVKLPISIFYGWITIAYPLGFTLWLMQEFRLTGREVFSPEIWSTLIVLVALLIFATLLWLRKVSLVYVCAGIWGLYWIYQSNTGLREVLAITAAWAAGILLLEIVWVKGLATYVRKAT